LLGEQIQGWLDGANIQNITGLIKVLIVPHAGYRYSGATAAYCYKLLQRQRPKKIILLGPSHHSPLRPALWKSSFHAAATPFGPLKLGVCFGSTLVLDEAVDRNEHSLEMQFPFIKFCCPDAEIVPYLIGSYNKDSFSLIAAMLREALWKRDDTVMVVSSDFCHYGRNYGFYPDLQAYAGETVSEKIKALDTDALNTIFAGDPEQLLDYLERTRNTICGRNSILLAMMCIKSCALEGQWTLLDYSQSLQIIAEPDRNSSSVSYIAAAFTEHSE